MLYFQKSRAFRNFGSVFLDLPNCAEPNQTKINILVFLHFCFGNFPHCAACILLLLLCTIVGKWQSRYTRSRAARPNFTKFVCMDGVSRLFRTNSGVFLKFPGHKIANGLLCNFPPRLGHHQVLLLLVV